MSFSDPDVAKYWTSLSWAIEMELLHSLAIVVLWSLLWWPFQGLVKGHAIFWEPPSRASLGKHNMNFCNVPINNDHMSLYCGGIEVSLSIFFMLWQISFIMVKGINLKPIALFFLNIRPNIINIMGNVEYVAIHLDH